MKMMKNQIRIIISILHHYSPNTSNGNLLQNPSHIIHHYRRFLLRRICSSMPRFTTKTVKDYSKSRISASALQLAHFMVTHYLLFLSLHHHHHHRHFLARPMKISATPRLMVGGQQQLHHHLPPPRQSSVSKEGRSKNMNP